MIISRNCINENRVYKEYIYYNYLSEYRTFWNKAINQKAN
jgi:hypothetical protein